MRSVSLIALLVLVPGCYDWHSATADAGGEQSATDAAPDAADAYPPVYCEERVLRFDGCEVVAECCTSSIVSARCGRERDDLDELVRSACSESCAGRSCD